MHFPDDVRWNIFSVCMPSFMGSLWRSLAHLFLIQSLCPRFSITYWFSSVFHTVLRPMPSSINKSSWHQEAFCTNVREFSASRSLIAPISRLFNMFSGSSNAHSQFLNGFPYHWHVRGSAYLQNPIKMASAHALFMKTAFLVVAATM